MRIAIAQIKGFLGDFQENRKNILSLAEKAKDGADILITPEGGLSGFPPRDLIWQKDFIRQQNKELKILQNHLPGRLSVLTGAFHQANGVVFNGAFLLSRKKKRFFKKAFLCNSDVFQESRYFSTGDVKDNFFLYKKKRVQTLICEDIFHNISFPKPDVILCLNGSPFAERQREMRLKALQKFRKYRCPIVYVNRTGGEGGVLYDGRSFVLDGKGRIIWEGRFFEEDFQIVSLKDSGLSLPRTAAKDLKARALPAFPKKSLSGPAQKEKALITGLRDFVVESGFQKAHLGLSGGIDSALTAYLAARALGPENVMAFFLPGPFTLKISGKSARDLSRNLQIFLHIKDISSLYHTFYKFLKALFPKNFPKNAVTAQNLQSRIRSLILTAFGNEEKSLLLCTGNKSELACGYSTLYGDLSGALAPIGDLYKTEVYALARDIDKRERIFPEKTLSRPPSAELAPRQKDSDDLGFYKDLDPLLQSLMQGGPALGRKQKRLLNKLLSFEFKRRQAPPALKISSPSFAKEERLFPVIHKSFLQLSAKIKGFSSS